MATDPKSLAPTKIEHWYKNPKADKVLVGTDNFGGDRGKGWNEETKSYTGVKKNNSWCRGQRMDFGKVIECNIKNLN